MGTDAELEAAAAGLNRQPEISKEDRSSGRHEEKVPICQDEDGMPAPLPSNSLRVRAASVSMMDNKFKRLASSTAAAGTTATLSTKSSTKVNKTSAAKSGRVCSCGQGFLTVFVCLA